MTSTTAPVDPVESDRPAPPAPPARLGRSWHLVWTAGTISVLGDGAFTAALPVLAAGFTRDPRLISGLATAGSLPWLVFSLHSGAIADRSSGRRLSIRAQAVQLLCVLLVGVVALGGKSGHSKGAAGSHSWQLAALYGLAFALGMAAVLARSAAQTLLPSIVPQESLITANSRLFTAQSVAKEFLGPALGAALLAAAPVLPFWADAATFAVSMLLLARLPREPARPAAARRRLSADVREGVSWLFGHRVLRSAALLSATSNFSNGMGYSTLVLFVGTAQYGVLLSVAAVGGVAGGLLSRPAMDRFGGRRIVRCTLVAAPLSLLGVGLLGPNPVVVGCLTAVGSLSAALWNVAAVSQRQRLAPAHLQGRVSSAGTMIAWGAQPLGALVGGLLAGAFGLAAPWIVGGCVRLVAAAAATRALREWTN